MAAAKKKPVADEATLPGKPSFFDRFHAWWEGYDLDAANDAPAPADTAADVLELTDEAPESAAEGPDAGTSAWPTQPRELVQLFWGEGFTSPGGAEFVQNLASGFALSPASSVLEIGSGLGGGARALAEHFGAYVAGWELDPELVAEAQIQAKVHSLEEKAAVHHLDPAKPEFRKNFYQGALVRDTLYKVEDKDALLAPLVGAIKSHCDLVIVEPMMAGADAALDGWIEGEEGPFFLWDEDSARASLQKLDLDVRSIHDNTDAYLSLILRGLAALVQSLQERRPARVQLVPTVAEVERWARLVAALESGALRHYWITAVKN